MSSVGRMDGAFFVSRTELLAWANGFFQLNLQKVEQCANGAVYCQVIDACHPGVVAMKKVNWAAKAEHESIPNYKVLQQGFDKSGIQRHIEVDKLVRGKYQDNLEMLQWIKTYFDRTYAGGDYDAISQRSSATNLPEWARGGGEAPAHGYGGGHREASGGYPSTAAAAPRDRPSTGGASRQIAGNAGGARAPPSRGRVSARPAADEQFENLKEEHERLREEVVDLKITVDGLETERDFYFQKLRDIEILCQALEANPDRSLTVNKFVENVQKILYAKDEEDEG